MKLNTKRSIFTLSMLLILFLSIAMVSASDIIADDDYSSVAEDSASAVSVDDALSDDSVSAVSLGDTDNDKSSFNKLGDSYLSDGDDANESDEKIESKINVYYDDYCVGDSAEISLNLVANDTYISGPVNVYLNEKLFATVESSVDYDVDIELTGLAEGKNTVNLLYGGNTNYAPSIASITIQSYSKEAVIEYEMDRNVLYGDELIIRTYLEDGDGRYLLGNVSVNVYDEDANLVKNATIYLMGTVSVDSSLLTPYKDYEVEFYYEGNDEYAPSKKTSYFTVLSEMETSIDLSYPEYSVSDSATFYFSLYDENGRIINETVDVFLNDEFYSSVVSDDEYIPVNLTGLNLGINNVSIIYNGSKFYKESQKSFNITGYEVQTQISINAPHVVVGKNAEITINLTDENDTIIDDEFEVVITESYYGGNESYVPLEETYNFTGNGTVTIEASRLNEGSDYNVYAVYKGNLTHTPSSDFTSFSVVSRGTEIDMDIPFYSDDDEVIANLSLLNKAGERIAGNLLVTVYDNESNLLFNSTVAAVEDDYVPVDIGKLQSGHYLISIKFNANHFYNGCEGDAYIHVFKASEIIIETSDLFIGQSETVNFTLAHSDGALLNETIYVTIFDFKNNKKFYDDVLNLSDGKASIDIENITEDIIIRAYYDNELGWYGPFQSEYAEVSQYAVINALEKTSPDATIELEPSGASILAILKDLEGNPMPDAVLNVVANDEEYNLTTDMEGKALIPAISGNGTVKVSYTDDDNLTVSNEILFISNVKEKIQTKIQYNNMKTSTVATADGRIGEYFEVNLTDGSGKAIANKLVQIGFNGKIYNRTTNATGGVSLQINLPRADLYTFALCFLGDEDYNGTFEVAVINVTKQAPKLTASAKTYKASAKTKSLTATLKTAKGAVLKNKSLVFIINGKLYNAKTNSKGVATVKVSISARGTYTCTVNSVADDTFTATSTKFTVKIT